MDAAKLLSTFLFFLRLLAELIPSFFIANYLAELVSKSLTSSAVAKTLFTKQGNFTSRLLALLAGWVTPFCSCGSVPIVAAMLKSRVSLGTSITFLISSPLLDIASTILLATFFGPTVAVVFVIFAALISLVAGYVVERIAPDGVKYDALIANLPEMDNRPKTWSERHRLALGRTLHFLRQLGPFIVLAAAIGAVIYGYLPGQWVANLSTKGILIGVPLATLLGVPVYASAPLIIPIGFGLLAKGVPTSIILAFMMGSAGLSLPEGVMLTRFFKPKLVAAFFSTVAVGIILVGYATSLFLK